MTEEPGRHSASSPVRRGHLVPPVVGAAIGLIVGVVVVMAMVVMAFGSALSGHSVTVSSFVVTTTTSGGDVTAQTGLGALVIPVVAAIAGFGCGLAVRRRRQVLDLGR